MSRLNAKEVTWEKVELLGKECLFNDMRIDRNSIPEGWYFYEVRHSDEDWGEPVEIGLGILVNFYGTLLSRESFELEMSQKTGNGYLWFDSEDWWYLGETEKL